MRNDKMSEQMSVFWYKKWYEDDVKPNLSKEEKVELLKKLSKLSLRIPLFKAGIIIKHKEAPELARFSNTKSFTGLQLYAVITELSKEVLNH